MPEVATSHKFNNDGIGDKQVFDDKEGIRELFNQMEGIIPLICYEFQG